MYMHVCVCMYAYIHMYTLIHTCALTRMYAHLHTDIHTSVPSYVHTHVHTDIHMYCTGCMTACTSRESAFACLCIYVGTYRTESECLHVYVYVLVPTYVYMHV